MSIRSNNKTFILNQVESKGNETTYEKMDMKATVKKDSLILDQGNNIIELAKPKSSIKTVQKSERFFIYI